MYTVAIVRNLFLRICLPTHQCEGVGGSKPATDDSEGPCFKDFLVLIHSHNGLTGDPQETRDLLVTPTHLLL